MNRKFAILLTFFSLHIYSQEFVLDWFTQIESNRYITSRCVTTNNNGDVYSGGFFNDINNNTDFDPSSNSTYYLNSHDYNNVMYIQKLDTNGNFIWAKSFENINNLSIPTDMKIRYEGGVEYIYILGYFMGEIDMDTSANNHVLTSSMPQYTDVFLLKLDAQGNFIWANRYGFDYYDAAYNLAFDDAGNIYFTGIYNCYPYDLILDQLYEDTAYGAQTLKIYKTDLNGNRIWNKTITANPGSIASNTLTVDAENNIIIAGMFSQTINFNSIGSNESFTSTNNSYSEDDIFILKINNNGDLIWAKHLEGGNETAIEILSDTLNNIYISGSHLSQIDFNPDPNVTYLSELANGRGNGFLLKLDKDGNFIWVNQFINALIEDILLNNDTLYLSLTTASSEYITQHGSFNLNLDQNQYATILNLDNDGNVLNQTNFTGGPPIIFKMDYYNNKLVCTGIYYYATDFDPDININRIFNLTSLNTSDHPHSVFTIKLKRNTSNTINIHQDTFNVYPNPIINNKFIVKSNNSKPYSILITDLSGKILLRLKDVVGDKSISLHQTKGMYIMKLKQNDMQTQYKLIKM